MKRWVISDTHFNHDKIIGWCHRPFKDGEQMNRILENNWNNIVSEEDTVYHLGDFGFSVGDKEDPREIFKRLNGNIVLVRGNHDGNARNKIKADADSLVLKYAGLTIGMCHNPARINPNCDLNLVGHVHDILRYARYGDLKIINMSVEMWNYTPVDLNKIISRYHTTNWDDIKTVDYYAKVYMEKYNYGERNEDSNSRF